jgi:hypothetical protein
MLLLSVGTVAARRLSVATALLVLMGSSVLPAGDGSVGTPASPSASAADDNVDRILRRIKDRYITRGDVLERLRSELLELRRRGQPMPTTRALLERKRDEVLETLTDEELLLAEADRLGAQVDPQFVKRRVRQWAKDRGITLDLEAEMRERRNQMRVALIQGVINHYRRQWPDATPSQVGEAYRRDRGIYARPVRVRIERLVLRPATDGEAARQNERLLAALRRAQASDIPAVAASATDEARLQRYIGATPGERPAVLTEHLRAIRAAIPAAAGGAGESLAADLEVVLKTASGQRPAAEILRDLSAESLRLGAITDPGERAAQLRAAAGRLGAPALASEWVEPGQLPSELEQPILSASAGALLGPLSNGGGIGLYLVLERDDAGVRPLDEVAAEIEARSEARNNEAMRVHLLTMLRRQIPVQELEALVRLPDSWFDNQANPEQQSDEADDGGLPLLDEAAAPPG